MRSVFNLFTFNVILLFIFFLFNMTYAAEQTEDLQELTKQMEELNKKLENCGNDIDCFNSTVAELLKLTSRVKKAAEPLLKSLYTSYSTAEDEEISLELTIQGKAVKSYSGPLSVIGDKKSGRVDETSTVNGLITLSLLFKKQFPGPVFTGQELMPYGTFTFEEAEKKMWNGSSGAGTEKIECIIRHTNKDKWDGDLTESTHEEYPATCSFSITKTGENEFYYNLNIETWVKFNGTCYSSSKGAQSVTGGDYLEIDIGGTFVENQKSIPINNEHISGNPFIGISLGEHTEIDPSDINLTVSGSLQIKRKRSVAKVEWVEIESPLDPNPNSGGGLRIFPAKQTPDDTIDRRRVRVKATINEPLEGITVYFKSFDVDDPNEGKTIDPNGSEGLDNRGSPKKGTLDALSAITDPNGVATVEFSVTMQPGDNFKIVATTNGEYLNTLKVDSVKVKDGEGNTLPTLMGKITPMLTVWRKLHIEVDSMGKVKDNRVCGNITGFEQANVPRYTIIRLDKRIKDKSKNISDTPRRLGRFENGTLVIADVVTIKGLIGNGNDFLLANTSGLNLRSTSLPFVAKTLPGVGGFISSERGVVAGIDKTTEGRWLLRLHLNDPETFVWSDYTNGTISIGEGPQMTITNVISNHASVVVDYLRIPFVVTDDDKIFSDIPMPNTRLLKDAFADAYTLPVYDVGDNNTNVPFVLNIDCSKQNELKVIMEIFDFDAKESQDDKDFWTIYLLGAYQANEQNDGDPNSELDSTIAGYTFSDIGVVIFMEPFSEFTHTLYTNVMTTVVHEIGHLFGGEHMDIDFGTKDLDHIMTDDPDLYGNKFNEETLVKIRKTISP